MNFIYNTLFWQYLTLFSKKIAFDAVNVDLILPSEKTKLLMTDDQVSVLLSFRDITDKCQIASKQYDLVDF